MTAEEIRALAEDAALLDVGRKAIEDVLVEFRDSRISFLNRGNGLVIRERDGRESAAIRMGTDDALRIGLKAIADHLGSTSQHSAKESKP